MNTTLSFPIKGQTILNQAKDLVPGFAAAFQKFQQHIVLQQNSPSLLSNYSRNLAFLSIHFGKIPHLVSIDELNAYLYHLTISQGFSISYFKQTVFGLKYWFRVFDMEAHALKMPMIKKTETLPQVLSKQECKALFKAPTNLKHRFLLAFAYSAGLRMNEIRHTKIADIDLDRMQIRVQKEKVIRTGMSYSQNLSPLDSIIIFKSANQKCIFSKGLLHPNQWANAAFNTSSMKR
ncbi:MAG: tyrosine-type recombinase/integrase [Bacteroidetes bacterium]|nr:tyrosine-type recombinase/integrase [Bacteroidota bacterium]